MSSLRSRPFRVRDAARSNSARASSGRFNFLRRSPRTHPATGGSSPSEPSALSASTRLQPGFGTRTPLRQQPRDSVPQPATARSARAPRRASQCGGQSGFLRSARSRMTGCDFTACNTFGPCAEPSFAACASAAETTTDEKLVPVCAVLIEEQDGVSRRAHTCAGTRRLDLHERNQSVGLRLLQRQGARLQNAPQPQRIFAERRPHPILTDGRRVATFVEDEIDYPKDRRQTGGG